MKECLIYDSSLKFSRAIYGVLTLIAFLLHNQWLVLLTCILLVLGTFSIKLNIPYQILALFKKKTKKRPGTSQKETMELKFVSGLTAGLLLVGFLFLYFGKYETFAWIFILVMALLLFLACFVGFCVATLMFVLLKKAFLKIKSL
ncbi:MAG: DUF4395 family protein [Patescibacteria group bacterium]